ncbi:MAG: pectate lyase [Candidatus Latescibacteria bacterium]|jgi:PelA/Pel-15E family pectate lyase|nr:pectate lyase [Candidatus Latescibacterota bacterium]
MMRLFTYICLVTLLLSISFFVEISQADPSVREVLDAMQKAPEFFVDEVSCRGGYLWRYSEDLSRGWGEAPARPTQIELHQIGTPHVGEILLRAFDLTGNEFYLTNSKKAANAIIWGQHPLGGWHYFIDFNTAGIRQWYKEDSSKFKWGMQEYHHYYGNYSFDDNATQSPTRFLLKLYMHTLDPVYRKPLLRALDFFLMAQYPNGAWPQRYPLMYEYVYEGHADYTSYYTFNDGVMSNNIDVLMEAWEQIGNEDYRKAAVRGMDFYIISQGAEKQAGWCEQHGMDLMPAWGRTHEPPTYTSFITVTNIRDLMRFYLMTGDFRYLNPIPGAIKWFEESTIEILGDGRHKLALYYEVGTNLPLYMHNSDDVTPEGYGIHLYDHDPTDNNYENEKNWWNPGKFTIIDIKKLKSEYNRLEALTPEEAMAEYRTKKAAKPQHPKIEAGKIEELIHSMDERGAWVEEIKVFLKDTTLNGEPAYSGPWANNTIQGISIFSFVRNMNMLMDYLEKVR